MGGCLADIAACSGARGWWVGLLVQLVLQSFGDNRLADKAACRGVSGQGGLGGFLGQLVWGNAAYGVASGRGRGYLVQLIL